MADIEYKISSNSRNQFEGLFKNNRDKNIELSHRGSDTYVIFHTSNRNVENALKEIQLRNGITLNLFNLLYSGFKSFRN